MLEKQLKVLLANGKEGNVNRSMLTSENKYKKENFLPYKNGAELLKRQKQSKSQRNRRKLTVSNNKSARNTKSIRSDNDTARSNYAETGTAHTPRYNLRNVRLVKSKQQFVEHQKRSRQYNDRSRHSRSSGLRSNIKSRASKCPKLAAGTNIYNYTQDHIMQNTLTDKSHSISKDSANISISTICKGIDSKKASLNNSALCKPGKYKHKLKVGGNRVQANKELNEESFEIYSKVNKSKLKMPKNKKYLNKLNSKMCPITIIQAPITVNGDSAVNVHQPIVLPNGKYDQVKMSSIICSR